MAVAPCGKFCPEIAVVVFVAVAEVSLSIFVAIVVTSEVSTNKINPPLKQLHLHPFPSIAT
jgi:hypothetical protein